LPTGILYGRHRAFTVETTGQLNQAKEFNPVILSYRGGHPVRLQDVAKPSTAWSSTRPRHGLLISGAMVLAVQRQPGTNTVEVADAVKKASPYFPGPITGFVSLHLLYDRSESIRESVRDVKFTLVFALLLVVIVIFLFCARSPQP